LEFACIEKEVVLAGQYGKIEIWSGKNYKISGDEIKGFPALAEKLMGGSLIDPEEE